MGDVQSRPGRMRATFRRRSRRIAALGLGGIACALAMASFAHGAFYKEVRENNIRFGIRTTTHRVVHLHIRTPWRCPKREGQETVEVDKKVSLRIGPRGRFTWFEEYSLDARTDRKYEAIRLVGRIHGSRLTGRFRYRYWIAPGGFLYHDVCYTGRSWKDSWIRFVANQVRPR